MALAVHAVGRDGQGVGRGRNSGGSGIEDQQHLTAAAVEQMARVCLGKGRKPEDVAVKDLGCGEVLGVKHGLENTGRDHMTTLPKIEGSPARARQRGRGWTYATVSFCSWTSSAMPFLASAISWSKPSCEKGKVATGRCPSTRPPQAG